MIKYDIGYNIGDFVQTRTFKGAVFGIITHIKVDYRKGPIITVLTLSTLDLSKEYLYSDFVILFGDVHIKKITGKDLIEQLTIKYKLYLLEKS